MRDRFGCIVLRKVRNKRKLKTRVKIIACLHAGRGSLCNFCTVFSTCRGILCAPFLLLPLYWSPTGPSVFTRGECVRFSGLQFHSYLARMPTSAISDRNIARSDSYLKD